MLKSGLEMNMWLVLPFLLLATLVLPASPTCTEGTCREYRDMDLEDEEYATDRYLRRSNELLAHFSKDLTSEKRAEGSIVDLGERVRLLEDDYREVLDAGNPIERERLRAELLSESRDLCIELDIIQGAHQPECSSNPTYRMHDGSCNNLKQPRWGRAVYPLRRAADASYRDGISKFCGTVTLPTAREVSVAITGSDDVYNPINPTQLVMHYAQFVDHDLVHIPTEAATCEGCTETEVCCPIGVPDGDPVFSSLECLQFKRSRPTLSADCDPRVRSHENQITSYLDSSNVYGSSDADAEELRDKTKGMGQMNVNEEPIDLEHLPVLPPDETNTDCTVGADNNLCGKGGDIRAAEQPGLTGLHTVLVREHNRLATGLHMLNGDWDDDRTYQEARRIVNAIYQHITYNEFLPVLLGQQIMQNRGLSVGNNSPYTGYEPAFDATITNSFATAAFRFGHSFVPEFLKRVNSKYDEVYARISLREAFFNATYVHDFDNGGVDAIMLGMIDERLLAIDRHFSEAITSFLFASEGASFGMDLVSLNIQRGRDHGMPSYADLFQLCHNRELRSFADLTYTERGSSQRLRDVYDRVRDIDAFVGMVTEEPIRGAAVGPTAGCIIATQFNSLKYGDRFWYENLSGVQAFTPGQLNQIRKASYARLLCDNLADVLKVQPYAFLMPRRPDPSRYQSFVEFSRNEMYPGINGELPGFANKRMPCNNIPAIDLTQWQEIIPWLPIPNRPQPNPAHEQWHW